MWKSEHFLSSFFLALFAACCAILLYDRALHATPRNALDALLTPTTNSLEISWMAAASSRTVSSRICGGSVSKITSNLKPKRMTFSNSFHLGEISSQWRRRNASGSTKRGRLESTLDCSCGLVRICMGLTRVMKHLVFYDLHQIFNMFALSIFRVHVG